MLEYSNVEPEYAYHVTSNLNWFRYVSRVKNIVKILPEGSKILEVGCGWGQVVAMIKALRPDLEVVGSDIEKSGAWKKLKPYGCIYIKCDAKSLHFDDNEFYAVISFGVMEHVKNNDKFLEEIFRVLQKGGHNFIFDLPNKYGFSEVVIGRLLNYITEKDFYSHEVRYTKEDVKKLLIKHGFRIVDIRYEFLIPAQVNRVSRHLGRFFDKYYLLLAKVDKTLVKTLLAPFAQTISIRCRKP